MRDTSISIDCMVVQQVNASLKLVSIMHTSMSFWISVTFEIPAGHLRMQLTFVSTALCASWLNFFHWYTKKANAIIIIYLFINNNY